MGDERRRHQRYAVTMPAQVWAGNEWREAVLQDVSTGGTFIQTSEPPASGECVWVRIWPPGDADTPVAAQVLVRWSMEADSPRAASGFGGQWVQIVSEDLDVLRTFLQDTLKAKGGFVAASTDPRTGRRRFVYRFPVEVPDVPHPPSASEAHDDEEERREMGAQRVLLPARFRTAHVEGRGTIPLVSETIVAVECDGPAPTRADRVIVETAIQGEREVYPLSLHGYVTRVRRPDADEGGPTRFYVAIHRVEEFGRKGLFHQFLDHLAHAA